MSTPNTRPNAHAFGVLAEGSAGRFLSSQGYNVLRTRYRSPCGEIDVIAKRDNHIAFVEVKARKTLGEAAWTVLPRQRQRIMDAATLFLAEHPDYHECSASFDVILVSRAQDIMHIPQAFMAD